MNLFANPIFITQKRLVHRGGVLAAILIAALIGGSLLSGMVAYRADPGNFRDIHSPQEAGKMFYGWTIAAEILVVVAGSFSRISRTLGDERKAGLWDSNRLTPLNPKELLLGYWLGPALREFYMGLVLAGTGLLTVMFAQLPLTFWLGTQLLVLSTALFFGLLAVLVGMAFQRPQVGLVTVLAILFLQPFSFFFPRYELNNFLLPTYGIAQFFNENASVSRMVTDNDWHLPPELFGLSLPPVLLTLLLQGVVGMIFWRGAIRKTTNPFRPLFLRREAVALFAILLLAQHGLIWGLWDGKFPALVNHQRRFDQASIICFVHCGTILLGMLMLAAASPQPETMRVKALRREIKGMEGIFSRSSVSVALGLGAVASCALLLQFGWAFGKSWPTYLVAAGNQVSFFLIFALLFEFCRLRHGRRAIGFIALWLFILCFLPFILRGVFGNSALAEMSLLAPGVSALSETDGGDLSYLSTIVAAHFVIAFLLWMSWQREWRRLLAKAAAGQN